MSKIYHSMTELVGQTPLLAVERLLAHHGITDAEVVVKVELFNPSGSVKDRIALGMIEAAEAAGQLKPGAVIVEPTSGNTGIGLAAVAAAKGYRAILVMPESMSVERRKILQGFGAELVLTEAAKGMKGAIARAEELVNEMDNAFMPRQFDNPVNPEVHARTTGPEIWAATDGRVDAFVAGVGTGGTVTGTGRYLKQQNPGIHVVAVEPSASPVLSGGAPGAHQIQGIGAGFVPGVMDVAVCDEVIQVTNEQALEMARQMATVEGVLVGISSGAALVAAFELAKRPDFKGRRIVAMLPDTGERYLSTALFE